MDGDWWSSLLFGVGAMLYCGNAMIVLFLWKDEHFGGTFSSQLNRFSRSAAQRHADQCGSPGGNKDRKKHSDSATLSVRGLLMVFVLSLMACLALIDLIIAFYVEDGPEDTLRGTYSHLLPLIFSQMFLVLQSAVVRLPAEQPFRCLMICMRWLTIPIGVFLLYDMLHLVAYGRPAHNVFYTTTAPVYSVYYGSSTTTIHPPTTSANITANHTAGTHI
jgi:hypothetical protein